MPPATSGRKSLGPRVMAAISERTRSKERGADMMPSFRDCSPRKRECAGVVASNILTLAKKIGTWLRRMRACSCASQVLYTSEPRGTRLTFCSCAATRDKSSRIRCCVAFRSLPELILCDARSPSCVVNNTIRTNAIGYARGGVTSMPVNAQFQRPGLAVETTIALSLDRGP